MATLVDRFIDGRYFRNVPPETPRTLEESNAAPKANVVPYPTWAKEREKLDLPRSYKEWKKSAVTAPIEEPQTTAYVPPATPMVASTTAEPSTGIDYLTMAKLSSPNTIFAAIKERLAEERQKSIAPYEAQRGLLTERLATVSNRTAQRLGTENLERLRVARDYESSLLRAQSSELDRRIESRQTEINNLMANIATSSAETFQSLMQQQQQDLQNQRQLEQLEMQKKELDLKTKSTLFEIQSKLPEGIPLSTLGFTGAEGELMGLAGLGIGKVHSQFNPVTGEQYVYDEQGNLIQMLNPLGQTTWISPGYEGISGAPGGVSMGAPLAAAPTEMPEIYNINLNQRVVAGSSNALSALQKADAEMFSATGQHIQVTDDYRTPEQQRRLYASLAPMGQQVAPPWQSQHNFGNAFDISNWKDAQPYLVKQGLLNGVAVGNEQMARSDPGHFSLAGTEFAPPITPAVAATPNDQTRTDTQILTAYQQAGYDLSGNKKWDYIQQYRMGVPIVPKKTANQVMQDAATKDVIDRLEAYKSVVSQIKTGRYKDQSGRKMQTDPYFIGIDMMESFLPGNTALWMMRKGEQWSPAIAQIQSARNGISLAFTGLKTGNRMTQATIDMYLNMIPSGIGWTTNAFQSKLDSIISQLKQQLASGMTDVPQAVIDTSAPEVQYIYDDFEETTY